MSAESIREALIAESKLAHTEGRVYQDVIPWGDPESEPAYEPMLSFKAFAECLANALAGEGVIISLPNFRFVQGSDEGKLALKIQSSVTGSAPWINTGTILAYGPDSAEQDGPLVNFRFGQGVDENGLPVIKILYSATGAAPWTDNGTYLR